jgi:hypothetical protein
MANRRVHPLVEALATELKPPAVGRTFKANTAGALAYATYPDRVIYVGFLGAVIPHDGKEWQLLYLDIAANECLLLEDAGIVAYDTFTDETVPFEQKRDVVWLRRDALVGGPGSASPSVEALFLTGPFTQAGDFEAPTTGTTDAVTGVFCEARTPSCCRIRTFR